MNTYTVTNTAPMSYVHQGRQYIVIATSEKDGSNAKLNAFALPD